MDTIQLIPPLLSAAAAIASALCAVLLLRIQRQNLIDAARPEVVIDQWTRVDLNDPLPRTVVTFRRLRNVGKGPAFNVLINASSYTHSRRPITSMSTVHVPLLASSESVDVNADITIWFSNVEPGDGGTRVTPLEITIHAWDYRRLRHVTTYHLRVAEHADRFASSNMVAPGVMLGSRRTDSRAVWRLQVRAQLRRMPVLRRLVRETP